MSDVSISIVTKMLYSSAEIFLDSGWTPKDMPPWMTVAIISQPLWRKNVACGLWSIVGMASILSSDMGAQSLPDAFNGEKAIHFQPRMNADGHR